MNCKTTGRPGFIYSIDATLGVFLMVLVLATVIFLSGQADEDPIAQVQVVRLGKDVLASMDDLGILATLDPALIGSTLNSTLPSSIGAHLQISTYYYDSGSFNLVSIQDFGEPTPQNITIYGARRDFLAVRNRLVSNYSIARISLWQK